MPITFRSTPKPRAATAALAGLVACLPGLAGATAPDLSFNSWAQVYGYVNTSYSSPYLGNVSFTLNGTQDYRSNYSGSGSLTTGVANAVYTIESGHGGLDPMYDIVTSSGEYGFHYDGRAEVAALNLRTQMTSATTDSSGQRVESTPYSSTYSYAQAQWSQGFYIGATTAHKVGDYGAVLVGVTLDGGFPALANTPVFNNGWTRLQASSSFTDVAGVSYTSSFSINTDSSDSAWSGAKTVYKKLLFQYGTQFNIDLWQYAGVGNNGDADFFNTGRVSSFEIPFGATLDSGASQAGLGSLAQLYGNVYNSPTVDDENTNWDFGNGGGGFHPPVPEPQTYALLLAGLGVLGWSVRRRRMTTGKG